MDISVDISKSFVPLNCHITSVISRHGEWGRLAAHKATKENVA